MEHQLSEIKLKYERVSGHEASETSALRTRKDDLVALLIHATTCNTPKRLNYAETISNCD